MKRLLLFPAILLCLSLFAQNQETSASAWNKLQNDGLANAGFKIPVSQHRARLLLGVICRSQTRPQIPAGLFDWDQFGNMEGPVYNNPALWEALFERLGGEFWLGSLTQPGTFTSTSASALRCAGLQTVIPAGRFAAIEAAAMQGNFTATARFPVMVFDPVNGEVRQSEGKTSIEIKNRQVQLAGRAYFFSPGTVQLFAGAGALYIWQTTETGNAEVEGLGWSFTSQGKYRQYGLLGQAGISLQPAGWPVFAEIGAAVQKAFGKNTSAPVLALQATVGWKWR